MHACPLQLHVCLLVNMLTDPLHNMSAWCFCMLVCMCVNLRPTSCDADQLHPLQRIRKINNSTRSLLAVCYARQMPAWCGVPTVSPICHHSEQIDFSKNREHRVMGGWKIIFFLLDVRAADGMNCL